MSSFRRALAGVALFAVLGACTVQADGRYPGVGRTATQQEVAAWDIDVRPDFQGLPAGSGTVAKGQNVWEEKCAQCHGIFGESGEVFSPLVGGVTRQDIQNGRVANLRNQDFPWRTTFMKVATVSTIWDYINRATPWTAPKSLTTEEVYAVLAFLLHLNGIVPDSFTLSDTNIREVQDRMPNRNGMTTRHALWPGSEFGSTNTPDTHNVACMKNCTTGVKLASFLPPPAPLQVDVSSSAGKTGQGLLQKNGCTVCHGVSNKMVGPAFTDVAKKHAGKAEYLAGKIKSGGSGIWGSVPMPAQTVSEADANSIAAWLASGAGN